MRRRRPGPGRLVPARRIDDDGARRRLRRVPERLGQRPHQLAQRRPHLGRGRRRRAGHEEQGPGLGGVEPAEIGAAAARPAASRRCDPGGSRPARRPSRAPRGRAGRCAPTPRARRPPRPPSPGRAPGASGGWPPADRRARLHGGSRTGQGMTGSRASFGGTPVGGNYGPAGHRVTRWGTDRRATWGSSGSRSRPGTSCCSHGPSATPTRRTTARSRATTSCRRRRRSCSRAPSSTRTTSCAPSRASRGSAPARNATGKVSSGGGGGGGAAVASTPSSTTSTTSRCGPARSSPAPRCPARRGRRRAAAAASSCSPRT